MKQSNLYPFHEKIERHHLDRLAIVYIRQSTLQQVHRHQESTRLQYGLKEKALNLGWTESQILIIDEDLGQSGSSIEGRPGFQRLVAEIGLNHVGLVLGIEMSRLARSCRDWYHLLEICSVFDTLIGDSDGIYNPSDYNDRLLLGLKGTMSEAELHILKNRMLAGKKSKAKRGELGMRLPIGYVKRPSGEVVKDLDEQARNVVEMIFDLFGKYRTVNGVLRYLVEHQIQVPTRYRSGPEKGELQWSAPNRVTLSNLLHHPIYAGAYSYGRRLIDPARKKAGRPSTGRTIVSPEKWEVLIKDHYPAYISWQCYESNLAQLKSNTSQALGVVRQGPALLSGLLICGRCGLKMAPHYQGKGLRYACYRTQTDYGQQGCQSLEGFCLDYLIEEWMFKAIEPSALEISLKVAEDLELERKQLEEHWKQRLERAHYQTQRCFRQYNMVDPENRLVLRTLEAQWEEALREEETLKKNYHRFLSQHPQKLSAQQKLAIERIAKDLPTLWHAQTTQNKDRQSIVRLMIERVIVTVEGETEKVRVEIHWIGGHQSHADLIRPVATMEQLSYYQKLYQRAQDLLEQGKLLKEVAEILNQEGFKPAKRTPCFSAKMVAFLLGRKGNRSYQRKTLSQMVEKKENEWTLDELAGSLGISKSTLYHWHKKGYFQARFDHALGKKIMLASANETKLKELEKQRDTPRKWARHVVIQ